VSIPIRLESASAETEPEPDAGESPGRGSAQRTIGIVLAVADLAAMGLGTYFAVRAQSEFDDASGHCGRQGCDPQGYEGRKDALGLSNASNALFIGGAGAIVTGALSWLTAPRASATQPSVGVTVGPGGGTLRGRF
jgi:hypothetical protein